MKTLNRIIMVGTLALSLSAHAGREGGGGAGSAITFQKRALEFIKDLRENSKYKKLNSLGLDAVLDGAHFMAVNKPQPAVKYGYIQDSDATNHKKGTLDKKQPNLIILYRAGWDKIAAQDALIGKTLACHELVSLKGLEQTGVYDLCRGYLAGMMGLPLEPDGRVKVNKVAAPTQLEAEFSGATDEIAKTRREIYQKVEQKISEAILANLEVFVLNLENRDVKKSTLKIVDSQISISESVLRNSDKPVNSSDLPIALIEKAKWDTDKDIQGRILMQGTAIIRTTARSQEFYHDPHEHPVNMLFRIPFKLAIQKNPDRMRDGGRRYDSAFMNLLSGNIEAINLDTKKRDTEDTEVHIENDWLWERLGPFFNAGGVHDPYAADLTFLTRRMTQALWAWDNVPQLQRNLKLTVSETAAMMSQIEIAKAHIKSLGDVNERFDDPKTQDDRIGTDTLYAANLHRDLKAQTWDKFISMLTGPLYIDTTGGGLHHYLREGLAHFAEINGLNIRDEYQTMNLAEYPISGIVSEDIQRNRLKGEMRALSISLEDGALFTKEIEVTFATKYDPKAKLNYPSLVITGYGRNYKAETAKERAVVFKPVVVSLYNYGSAVSMTDISCGMLNRYGYGDNAKYCNFMALSGSED